MTRTLAPARRRPLPPLHPSQPPSNRGAPAKQLAKFGRLIGDWTGKGSLSMPGLGEMPWTSTSRVRKVLGGHFVRDDTTIDFGGAMPGKLQMITFLGWDKERERYVQLNANNMGGVEITQIHWNGRRHDDHRQHDDRGRPVRRRTVGDEDR